MILLNEKSQKSVLLLSAILILCTAVLFPMITHAVGNDVQAGELVITEVMANPAELPDANGEWFEVYNPGTTSFDLNGCKIRDDGTNSHTISGTVTIAPMSYAVLARDAISLTTTTVAYEYASFDLSNATDEIIIECNGVEIDRVEYDSAKGFPAVASGASMQLNAVGLDNNVGANWSVSTQTWAGSTDKGTPNMANAIVATPTPDPNATATPTPNPTIAPTPLPTIVPGTGVEITEIMADPSELSDSNGEWFEVYNPSSTAFDLNGCKIRDNGSNSHTIATPVIVPPMGYAVLATNAISLSSVTVAYDYSSLTLNNTSDAIIIECNGAEIDRVEYDSAKGFPAVASGASMQLNAVGLDNNVGANWSVSTQTWVGSTDKGTPGKNNNGLPSSITLSSQKGNSSFATMIVVATLATLSIGSTYLVKRKQI